ncbi:ATP-dependent RNA helicase DHX58-like isoform X2 [Oculina patagonica]
MNEETKKYCVKEERAILNKYDDIRSDSTLQLRYQLHKDLPEGAAFSAVYQETKDNLPACKLRVSLRSAADQIWEDYANGKLMSILKENLLSGMDASDKSSRLRMRIHIMKEEYEWACTILAGGNQTDSSDETQKVKKDRIPPVFLDKRADPELKLRSYQHELSWPALEGKNSIICAPTNSGKTYVALGIAKAHLEKLKERGNKRPARTFRPKVLFVVNKVNLVLQQRQRFDYYLSNSYDITDISGANAQEKVLDEIIQENDVIVLTAQILVDALKSKRVSISDFSLIIFDECHHTDKGHPYNDIMLRYLEMRFPRVSRHHAEKERLPQIIGLTASLGVGKARNKNEAQEHILQLCANLDCSVIVTVEKHTKDLKGMTGRCERTCHEIPDGEMDYFDEIIGSVMITIEGMMPRLPAGRNGLPHVNRGSQQYQQWLKEMERGSVALKSRDQFTLVQHLMIYNTALAIKKSCRVKDALKYVMEFHDKQREDKFKDIDQRLRGLYEKAMQELDSERKKKGELKNPKLEAVAQLLRKKYQACVEEGGQQTAKGILFTQTRENTKALKAWLDENSDLAFIRAERLVGTGKGEDGMTQCQQEEVIASFRSGRVNLLVSTTVGEEGIDIPDCKYVIRYDVRGNEIASVQSRGRVRDKEGKYEVVAGKETGVIEKENLNVIREEMMEVAIKEVKAMDGEEYKSKILELQTRAIRQRQRKETSRKCEKDKRQQDKVKLFCRKCQVFACSGVDIRCIKEAHHVVIDKEFSSKFYFKKSKCPRVFNEIELTGPLHCQDCDAEWGVMLKYQSKEMPCIKASCFGFEFEDDLGVKTTFSFKKWKDVRFSVEDFDHCQTQVLDCCLGLPELCLD